MTATRLKVTAVDHSVPQTIEEVTNAVAEIGRLQRERQLIMTAMNEDLAATRAQFEADAKPHGTRIADLTRGVAIWCEAHRDELTKGGKTKTAKLATGEVSWRTRPPSVVVRGQAAVIAALQKLGLTQFLRVKTEIDKDKVLAEPSAVSAIRGLSISQREDFVIKPDSTELEEVR